MKTTAQLYFRRIVIAAIIYTVLIIGTRVWLRDLMDSPVRYVVAVLPVLPVLFGVFALSSFVRSIDELQRQIQLEGMVFSLGLTGVITFTLGLLEGTAFPFISMTWVMPMMIALWGIGVAIASRRYR